MDATAFEEQTGPRLRRGPPDEAAHAADGTRDAGGDRTEHGPVHVDGQLQLLHRLLYWPRNQPGGFLISAPADHDTRIDEIESEGGHPPVEPVPRRSRRLPLERADVLLLIVLILIGGALRFIRLAEPREIVFDETYYAKDACLYAGHDRKACDLDQDTEQSYVHPPLGKWMIAMGIKAFGYDSFGWRFPSAVFGTALVGLVFLLARRLTKDRWTSAAAGLFAAVDFLLIVQSRVAMLDIFLAFFITLGFLFLAYERERVLDERDRIEDGGTSQGRTLVYRFAAGAALGQALAVKWSAAWALAGAMLIALAWTLWLMRREKKAAVAGTGRWKEVAATIAAFTLVPGLIYLTTYSLYFVERSAEPCAYTVPNDIGLKFGKAPGTCVKGLPGIAMSFIDLHKRMASYHLELKATHKYQSKAWTWPFVKRPVAYYYEGEPKSSHILAFGNPLTWWASLAALPWLIARAARRFRAERLVLIGWGSQYLPWLVVARPLFFFYMTPVVPFMAIGLAHSLAALRATGTLGRRAVLAFMLVLAITVYFFYPVFAAVGLPYPWWHNRMLLPSWI